MPELPEVESIRRQLEKYIVGHTIENIQINYDKKFSGEVNDIRGAKVRDVKRYAKVLSVNLTNDYSIVIHIKMTGQLIYEGPNIQKHVLSKKIIGGVPGKHTHIIFYLDQGGVLYYNDVRKFGWIKIVKTGEVKNTGLIGKLGPEPFNGLTLKLFRQILAKNKKAVKLVLMDQEKMGGIGNIYANDALWLAKVNPKKPANQIQEKEAKCLYDAVLEVLGNGIKYGGASELSYITPDGQEGEYQKHTLIYGREGDVCERCHKEKFEKFFLSGRGTYWCPNCQKL